TLTFDNTKGKAPAAVDSTDDLSRVLDDATVITQPSLATGTGLIVDPIVNQSFRVHGTLDAGATPPVTYVVQGNNPDTGDHSLDNFVVGTGSTTPASCVSGSSTCTSDPVAQTATPAGLTQPGGGSTPGGGGSTPGSSGGPGGSLAFTGSPIETMAAIG